MNSTAFEILILSVALVATASCKSGESVTNNNSVVLSASRDNRASASTKANQSCLNLNIATSEDLINLPGIGEVMARRVIDYREQHGRFRRPEEIIIIEGFSERKYRAIAELICVE